MFKVGDWVYIFWNYKNQVGKIIDIEDDFYKVKFNESIEYVRDIKLWHPQEGEWCWFYDEGVSANILAKFVKRTNKGKYKNNMAYQSKWECCEPFIGELPGFIKE